MSSAIEGRLAAEGLALPPAAAPAANYVPYVVAGRLILVAGQMPFEDGRIAVTGQLGAGVSLAEGQRAARLCALNLLAQAKAACGGDLDRLGRCLKLGGFVSLHRRVHRASGSGQRRLGPDRPGDGRGWTSCPFCSRLPEPAARCCGRGRGDL